MKLKRTWILLFILMLISLTLISCTKEAKQSFAENNTAAEIKHTPETFLELSGLKTVGNAVKLDVTIPEDWSFKQGEYPEGLYWALANEFSMDAGLDLMPLKGKTLQAWRYSLADGLPGQDSNINHSYPSNAVLLVDDNCVVGAWLAFNIWGIGPSVKKNYLEDITGMDFGEWFHKQDLLIESEQNQDLAAMDPVQVLDSFCRAIEARDDIRANACLSPEEMRQALTVNLSEQRLYNPDYSLNNSYINNLLEAKLLSCKLLDAETLEEIDSIGDRTSIKIAADMKIKWKEEAFNSPDGIQTRYALMKKYPNGWKLLGLGTGP